MEIIATRRSPGRPRPAAAAVLGLVTALLGGGLQPASGQDPPVDLVTNGGFETPTAAWNGTLVRPGEPLAGWTVLPGPLPSSVVEIRQAGASRVEGAQYLHLWSGVLAQSLETVPGRNYRLRFALAGLPGGTFTKRVEVWWGGQWIHTFRFDSRDRTLEDMGWEVHELFLPAAAGRTELRFVSRTLGTSGPVLDAVSVTETSEPLPPPNLVVNGAFERPPVADTASQIDLTTSFEGWKLLSGGVSIYSWRYPIVLGTQSLHLNYRGPGSIAQEVPTEAGQTYRLRFGLAGHPGNVPLLKEVEVSWAGRVVDTPAYDMAGRNDYYRTEPWPKVTWEYHEYLLEGTGETTELRFTSKTPSWAGPILDEVSLTPIRRDLPTLLTGVEPRQAGNTGPVTFEVRGGPLDEQTSFRFVDGGGSQRSPTTIRFLREMRTRVTFDLAGLTPGPAILLVTRGNETARLNVTVVDGQAGRLEIDLDGVRMMRMGPISTWTVEYANTGAADLPAPLLLLKLPGATFVSDRPNGGNLGQVVWLLGLPADNLRPTLRPGERVRVPFFARFANPVSPDARVTLAAMDPFAEPLAGLRIDWSAREDPTSPALNDYAETLRGEIGNTVGELYRRAIAEVEALAERRSAYRTVRHVNGRWRVEMEGPSPETGLPIPPIDPDDLPLGSGGGSYRPLQAPPPPKPGDGQERNYVVIITAADVSNHPKSYSLEANTTDGVLYHDYFRYDQKIPERQIVHIADLIGRKDDTMTPERIGAAFDSLKGRIDDDDHLTVVYAGHGMGRDGTDGGKQFRKGDWSLNGGVMTMEELSRKLQEVGAGRNTIINESCLSGEFNRRLVEDMKSAGHPNTTGFAATDEDSVAFTQSDRPRDPRPTEFGQRFLRNLRECPTVECAFQWTQEEIRARYAEEEDPVRRQHPTVTNPNHLDLEHPWKEPPLPWWERLSEWWYDFTGTALLWRSRPINLIRSMDPNDKAGPGGWGPEGFLPAFDTLGYAIHFENLATATASAQVVAVTDVLDDDLDLSTLELGEIVFANRRFAVPAGSSGFGGRIPLDTGLKGLLAEARVALDAGSRTLSWTLTAIDSTTGQRTQDPLLGLLPPNNASHDGEGFVSFTIRPLPDRPEGTVIGNAARIVFDENPPIDTNRVTNTLDLSPPTSTVAPLPPDTSSPAIAVSWSGQDKAGGSGIAGYDVYASEDGGPWRLWQVETAATQAIYTGRPGHAYRFYSRARDGAGNAEPDAAAPQAETRVAAQAMVYGDLDGDGKVTVRDAIVLLMAVAGLRPPLTAEEAARADVAPRQPAGPAGDGKIAVGDAIRILLRTVGLEGDPWP